AEEYAKKLNSKIFPGIQGGPLCHVIAAKAVAFKEVQTEAFRVYARQIITNAQSLASALIERGYHLTSGGTDNHLMLVDLTNKDITGKDAQNMLDLANITTNRNTVPFETRSPFVTSGIRLGTPALTTRGMKEADMVTVADFIDRVLTNLTNEEQIRTIGEQVKEFSQSFPEFEDNF
ncbi:MAG: serine hydroxymethyltransferase, partial [Deltaproteobacteria bacterium]|nr:serine hydroxymethyltransferase [Deltaproteobacteria bacterium]